MIGVVVAIVVVAAVAVVAMLLIKNKLSASDQQNQLVPAKVKTYSTAVEETNPSAAMTPLDQRTFATSNYKRFYDTVKPAAFQHYLLSAVNDTLKHFAKRINPARDQQELENDVDELMKVIQEDAFKDGAALKNDVAVVAEYLWTSAKTHAVIKDMELCSVLNAVIRDDIAAEIEAAAIIFRTINSRRTKRVSDSTIDTSYPHNGETWRGGSFRREHRAFFERMERQQYRVPGFLATSSKRSVAAKFAFDPDSAHPCAIWRVLFDPRGEEQPQYRCRHMTFVSKTLFENEHEYLFAPYSVFTVLFIKWSDDLHQPHEISIQAAVDNKDEDENLPLTPWY